MSHDQFPRGKVAIVGAATYGMGESPGLSSMRRWTWLRGWQRRPTRAGWT